MQTVHLKQISVQYKNYRNKQEKFQETVHKDSYKSSPELSTLRNKNVFPENSVKKGIYSLHSKTRSCIKIFK